MTLGIILTVIGAFIVLALFLQALTVGIPVAYATYYIVIFAVGVVLLIAGIIVLVAKRAKSKPKKKYLPLKSFSSNIILGCISVAFTVGLALLWGWICSFMYEGHEPESIFSYINFVGIVAGVLFGSVVSAALVIHDFSNPVFGKYHPSGRTITETKNFVRRCYFEGGLIDTLCRIIRIFALINAAILIVMTIMNPYNISLLAAVPFFFVAIPTIWSEDEKYDEFIAERANCKGWREFVCKYCETLISGKALESTEHREGESTYHHDREITTTTTTTTSSDWMMIGDTEYIDTRVDTRVNTVVDDQEYIKTDHFDFYHYRCPRCKKIHTVGRTYTTRMDL